MPAGEFSNLTADGKLVYFFDMRIVMAVVPKKDRFTQEVTHLLHWFQHLPESTCNCTWALCVRHLDRTLMDHPHQSPTSRTLPLNLMWIETFNWFFEKLNIDVGHVHLLLLHGRIAQLSFSHQNAFLDLFGHAYLGSASCNWWAIMCYA